MITIRDVARRAQVSIATVSRVINGTRAVDPKIRERVLVAMQELDYRPNYLARGLRQRNTRMIGLITPDNSNPFYAEVARTIEDEGFAAGYSVILCNSDMSEEKQQLYVDVLLSRKVDGVILIEPVSPTVLERIQTENVPFVLANSDESLEEKTIDQVLVDTEQGGYCAGQYLARLNHRRIGCITISPPFSYTSRRIIGFRRALADAGIELSQDAFTVGNGRFDSGRKAMQELLQRIPDLTAVFVYNDLMALGAINTLHMAGRRIPDDISIIGFDNILYSSSFEPALTTIAQPTVDIGRECVAQLLQRLQYPDNEHVQMILPAQFIERSSCHRLAQQQNVPNSSSLISYMERHDQ
ncbi:MAG TPA: LacI family DNA-binding transcriptional regulator [Dictyobacter sp.]|jgi:LacI family transcriptional regulator|nr:LacI family DNA-binding transcriptional regulator [Dictyobacter sp.]